MKYFTPKGLQSRLAKLIKAIEEMENKVDELHVKLQKGNSKTGENCWTVSLMPIIDCPMCIECRYQCYDLRNDLRFPKVIDDRARNSIIHKHDIKRYWSEIDAQIKANNVKELRINVGGDLTERDFHYVAMLGKQNVETKILFFTKNYKGINKFLSEESFPSNVKAIMSVWEGMKLENPYNLPCSHVLYDDGRTTAPSYGAYYCTGNCSECAFNERGCWTLKEGEHVVFHAH